ncbi:hypothetical protein MBLNU457_2269t2 [Dothideomycetes sp. NU457]
MALQSPLTRSPEHVRRPPPSEPSNNVQHVVLGNLLIKPWYPSFYPEEIIGRKTERLYVCQWCFRYSKELMPYLSHMRVCPLQNGPPPGTLVYEKGDKAIYELDGEEHKLYAQNLSLFAKLFLDTKSVFYDVTTFRYYLLVQTEPSTSVRQVVGFFSKEKMSWDNNNVACILVFPPWQRKGLGQILMGVSYELSRREGRLGGPEKPLSSLGKKAYQAYWSAAIARCLLNSKSGRISIAEIVQDTYLMPEDVIYALKEMNVVDTSPSTDTDTETDTVTVDRARVEAWVRDNKASLTPDVKADGFLEAGFA